MPAMVDKVDKVDRRPVDKRVDSKAKAKDQPDRQPVDMERLEADYRAGILSVREIGKRHGISGQAVHKHAKAHGWQRDLTERIRQSAAAKLVQQVEHRQAMAPVEAEVIEASAKAITDIVLAQRTDIARTRKLSMDLVERLEQDKDLAIAHRTNVAANVIGVVAKAIEMERAAFGAAMPGSPPPDPQGAQPLSSMDEFKARLAAVLEGAKQ